MKNLVKRFIEAVISIVCRVIDFFGGKKETAMVERKVWKPAQSACDPNYTEIEVVQLALDENNQEVFKEMFKNLTKVIPTTRRYVYDAADKAFSLWNSFIEDRSLKQDVIAAFSNLVRTVDRVSYEFTNGNDARNAVRTIRDILVVDMQKLAA